MHLIRLQTLPAERTLKISIIEEWSNRKLVFSCPNWNVSQPSRQRQLSTAQPRIAIIRRMRFRGLRYRSNTQSARHIKRIYFYVAGSFKSLSGRIILRPVSALQGLILYSFPYRCSYYVSIDMPKKSVYNKV